jgi:MFS family permease
MKIAKTAETCGSSQPLIPTWFSRLNSWEKRAFAASFGGWAIDAFDFMIFSFAITVLTRTLGIDEGRIGLIGTATLLASAAGGWVAGMMADRFGRVKMLQGTILWFSVCTVLIGFAHNFEQLLTLRILQGFGFGGEWAIGAVLIGETVRPQDRGKAVGFVQSGWAVGWGVAALAYSVVLDGSHSCGSHPVASKERQGARDFFGDAEAGAGSWFKNKPDGDLFATAQSIYGQGVAAVHGTDGRLLRNVHLASHLFESRASSVGSRYWRIPDGSDSGFVLWLHSRRLPCGYLGTPPKFHHFLVSCGCVRLPVPASAAYQYADALLGISSWYGFLRRICGDGCISDRALSIEYPGVRAELLLQLRTRYRSALSCAGWLFESEILTRQRDCALCWFRVCARSRHGDSVARDERKTPAIKGACS